MSKDARPLQGFNVDAIIDDKVYLGNIFAARSDELRSAYGITHIVSVCPDHPSTGSNHLTIPVDDAQYEDILTHLPKACQFIQASLDEDGKVLVHCQAGISRSATVVCAYIMSTQHLSASAAIQQVKKHRPIYPNPGFVKQLELFAELQYQPSPTKEAYVVWKRQQEKDYQDYLSSLMTPIVPTQLYASNDFITEPEITGLGITHLLILSPTMFSPTVLSMVKHITLHNADGKNLLALRDACIFIHDGLQNGGKVLLYEEYLTVAFTVACAYLMFSRRIPLAEASAIVEKASTRFTFSPELLRQLESFNECGYTPDL